MCKASFVALALWLGCGTAVSAQDDSAEPFAPKFYAFQNGVSFGSFEDEAKTLKELGYDGISQVFVGGDKLAERIAAYDKVGLKVLSIYLNVDDQPIAAEVVKPLENRGALIELTIRKMTPTTVEAVRQTAEMAAAMKIRVALYPHHGNAVATMPQAMDLIAKVDHPNLGVMFNLCHFLKNEKAEDLESSLEKAGPHLFAVSTSGANLGGTGWSDLIKPLDQGNFPQQRLLRALKKLNFSGPVGLQCYGVRGDKRTNLKNSFAAWEKIIAEL
jgi:sugar phosphate isomerase/epimerase